jgi:hypothetical protein
MVPRRFRIAAGLALAALLTVPGAWAAEPDSVKVLAARIDELVAARWAADKVTPAEHCDDAEFLRRVYLEIAGHVPSAADARAFLDDTAADKRHALVEKLLASDDYVNHFTNVWRALLVPGNDPGGAPGQNGFDAWLRKKVADNAGHDALVREILTVPFAANPSPAAAPAPTDPGPAEFYLARDVKPEELAAGTARVFLGIRLECAQCHNHPFAKWKREQFWGYAAFFAGLQRQNSADGLGEIREVFDRRELRIPGPAGMQVIPASFLDGTEPRWKFKVGARVTLADWVTSPDNPYFARALANRTWAHFFGTGLVEPVDDLGGNNEPSHPELLDELGRAVAKNGFDRKLLIRAVTASKAYQLSSRSTDPAHADPRRFARMAVKGLTADQVYDSLVLATGYTEPPPRDGEAPPENLRARFLALFATATERRTEAQTSIPQALMLMNGTFTEKVTSLKGDGTLARVARDNSLTTAGRVEALYLATLSRRPNAAESERLVKFVEGSRDPHKALADVFWALLNSSEFILDH